MAVRQDTHVLANEPCTCNSVYIYRSLYTADN